jgi:hypothetical protein
MKGNNSRFRIRLRTAVALRAFVYGAILYGAAAYLIGLRFGGGEHPVYIALALAGAGGLGAAASCFALAALYSFYKNLLRPGERE